MNSLRRIVRALRLADRGAERQMGLSGAQLFVLHNLDDSSTISLNELAERTHTHQSSVSVVVQRLVDKRLVRRTRSTADARRVELELTAAGERALRKAPESAQDKLIDALGRTSSADRAKLARLLGRVVEEMGLVTEDAGMFFEDGAPAKPAKRIHEPTRRRTRKRA